MACLSGVTQKFYELNLIKYITFEATKLSLFFGYLIRTRYVITSDIATVGRGR